jgi:protein-tyrosine phosphatase
MVPGVDDGPADIKEALEMIEASYNDGIRHIVLTSHLNHPLGFSGEDDYDGIFCNYKKLVKERYPDLKIYPGAEVYISRKTLSEMDKIDIRTINNTKYVLVEFSRNVKFHEMDMAVHELKLMGYKTIIAHIEQYHLFRQKYEDIRQLKDDGAVIQCNGDSFNKSSSYSSVVGELMKRNLVDLVASDYHNMADRAPGLKKTYEFVKRKYGKETANRIFLENPDRIIKGDELDVLLDTKGKAVTGRRSKLKFTAVAAVAAVGICVTVLFMSKVISPVVDIEVAAVEDSTITDVEEYYNVDNISIESDNIDNAESSS